MRKQLFITGIFLLIVDMVLRQTSEPEKMSGDPVNTIWVHALTAAQFVGEMPITKMAPRCIAAGVAVGMFDKYFRKETQES